MHCSEPGCTSLKYSMGRSLHLSDHHPARRSSGPEWKNAPFEAAAVVRAVTPGGWCRTSAGCPARPPVRVTLTSAQSPAPRSATAAEPSLPAVDATASTLS